MRSAYVVFLSGTKDRLFLCLALALERQRLRPPKS